MHPHLYIFKSRVVFSLNSSKLYASDLDETQTVASSITGRPVSSVRLVSCKLG